MSHNYLYSRLYDLNFVSKIDLSLDIDFVSKMILFQNFDWVLQGGLVKRSYFWLYIRPLSLFFGGGGL